MSHDRYFVESIANKIWYIEDHEIKQYPGTYNEYETWIEERGLQSAVSEKSIVSSAPPQVKPVTPAPAKTQITNKSDNQKALKQAKKNLEELESTITKLEKQKVELETKLADPHSYAEKDTLNRLNDEYAAVQKQLSATTEAWEVVMLEVEELAG